MDQHVILLSDAVGAVGGLILHRWIPPAIEMNDVVRGCQIQPRAAGFERKDKKRRTAFVLKGIDQLFAVFDGSPAVEHQAGPAKNVREKSRQGISHLAKLGEDEHL